MSNSDKKKKRSLAPRLFLWSMVLVILYFLSLGPFMLFAQRGDNLVERKAKQSNYKASFYGPWFWTYDQTLLHKPMGQYMHFWSPKTFNQDGEWQGLLPKSISI